MWQLQVTKVSLITYILALYFRRGKAESGDIDTLLTHPSYASTNANKKSLLLKQVVETLERCSLITDTISLGDTKFMVKTFISLCSFSPVLLFYIQGACKLSGKPITRRLDIRLIPHDQYYCGILYFTGSDMFNKEMRAHALEAGFTLNEYTLRPVGSTGTLFVVKYVSR